MAEWYVKDLSKLTQVSVQTLHYYDRIGLLEPSVRLPNGYRLYSEKDLFKLQQIIALKYFGFGLVQIKTLLTEKMDVTGHLSVQAKLLEEKANTLIAASKILRTIISDSNGNKSIPWENTIKSIEVYRMTQELEKSWEASILTPEELKAYAQFRQELPQRFSPEKQQANEKAWADLANDVNANLSRDPASSVGREIGKRCLDWVNTVYGKQNINLRITIWEKGFKQGHGENYGLSAAAVEWLDQAMSAHYMHRAMQILQKIDSAPHAEVLALWNGLLTDIFGDEEALKKEAVREFIRDNKLSPAAINWLKNLDK